MRYVNTPDGVDLSHFDGEWFKVSPEIQKLAERDDVVLFMGRLNWKKGLDRLVDALAKLGRGHLVIAGTDDGYESTLRKQINLLGLEDRVTFLGQVSGRDKQALLESSRMLVLPSFNENFGNVVARSDGGRTFKCRDRRRRRFRSS